MIPKTHHHTVNSFLSSYRLCSHKPPFILYHQLQFAMFRLVFVLLWTSKVTDVVGWCRASQPSSRRLSTDPSHGPSTGRSKSTTNSNAALLGMVLERRDFLEATVVTASVTSAHVLFTPTHPCYASYIDPNVDPPSITKRVYLDVAFDFQGEPTAGRIEIGLYGYAMPRTVENFATLCASNAYAGTTFYRILSDFSIQGGAIGDPSGKTGKSSLENGMSFEPDNYSIKHTKKGLVSMVKGVQGVDSRFFINCVDDGGWGDDRYAVFGIVEKGFDDIVKKIEKVPVSPPKNGPKTPVTIVASGVV
jgi:cyclophilin family peptidyl-prolyl cis-trans isomerase